MKCLVILLSVFVIFPSFSNVREQFNLKPGLKQNFLKLVSKANDFHKVIQEGGDKFDFTKEAMETKAIIQGLYTDTLSLPHLHQRLHSHKLLKTIEDQVVFLQSQGVNGNNKKMIKKFFNSFFELVQVYNLKKDITGRIFYCPKDKSTWFQSNNRPKNPINPNLKNCGRRL